MIDLTSLLECGQVKGVLLQRENKVRSGYLVSSKIGYFGSKIMETKTENHGQQAA